MYNLRTQRHQATYFIIDENGPCMICDGSFGDFHHLLFCVQYGLLFTTLNVYEVSLFLTLSVDLQKGSPPYNLRGQIHISYFWVCIV